ncbi:VWA domain-containing protein [Propionicicella superfundia]|uniref:VWA domain-containing protein n=1 Tax=Propionicicella superfundia TaxID=348582 RepID=UPI000401CAEA|nr:VWA domain-containing protein [Propionicicella superfundia]
MVPLLEFMAPARLWGLLLVPVLVAVYLAFVVSRRVGPRRDKSPLERMLPQQAAWKRHLAVGAAVLSLVSINGAWAMPMSQIDVPRDRATVVVALDVSRSMMATDVSPDRITAAKQGAVEFVDMVPERFNLALVSFAGTANLVVPPSTDRAAMKNAIEALEVAPATATGDAIYTALESLSLAPADPDNPDEPVPAAIVLLSDGQRTIGRDAIEAAKAAKEQNVPVYTIAYGTQGGYVMDGGVRQPVPVNHSELDKIARASGGQKFSAATPQELEQVYKTIAQSVGTEKVNVEITWMFVGVAAGLGLLAALAMISLAARWP